MKIIFLDIDGVMNCQMTWRTTRKNGFDSGPSKVLKYILDATGAYVVVSGALGRTIAFEDLKTMFQRVGIDSQRIFGVTDFIGTRGNDITNWLNEHPGITERYILIDDAGLDDVQPHGRRLVHTLSREGLLPSDAPTAIRLLNE